MKFYSALGLLSLLASSTAIRLHEGNSFNLKHEDEVSDYVSWQVSMLTRIDANEDDEITKEELEDASFSPRSQELILFQYDADQDGTITKAEVQNELYLEVGAQI